MFVLHTFELLLYKGRNKRYEAELKPDVNNPPERVAVLEAERTRVLSGSLLFNYGHVERDKTTLLSVLCQPF